MATIYSLFFGVLFTALCPVNRDGSSVLGVFKSSVVNDFYTLYQGRDFHLSINDLNYFEWMSASQFFLDEKTKQKTVTEWSSAKLNQGLVAQLLAQAASGSYFFSAKKYAKTGTKCSSAKLNSSLKTFDTKSVHPSTIVKFFVGDKWRGCTVFAYPNSSVNFVQPRPSYSVSASCPLQPKLMSPVKYLAFKDDLLAYGVKGRKATNSSSVHFALDQDSQSKGGIGGQGTLGTASVALRSRDEHRLNSLDLCGTFYQGKVPRWSANEDKRNLILTIASAELGTTEATGKNDGPRVEEYLRYTNLPKGHEWCAAFASWVYGQAGFDVPRNPWSPALFPKARVYWRAGKFVDSPIRKSENSRIGKPTSKADVFGIYGAKVKRINHVGLVKEASNDYLISIEGNSNNRVESRRRHLRTVYALADWVE